MYFRISDDAEVVVEHKNKKLAEQLTNMIKSNRDFIMNFEQSEFDISLPVFSDSIRLSLYPNPLSKSTDNQVVVDIFTEVFGSTNIVKSVLAGEFSYELYEIARSRFMTFGPRTRKMVWMVLAERLGVKVKITESNNTIIYSTGY